MLKSICILFPEDTESCTPHPAKKESHCFLTPLLQNVTLFRNRIIKEKLVEMRLLWMRKAS